MKRTRILGLCLVAVFALSAAIASSASAAPGWYECAKAAKNGDTKSTQVNSLTSTVPAAATEAQITEGKTNKYELKAGIGKGKGFKGKSVKATLYTTTPLGITAEVSCTSAATPANWPCRTSRRKSSLSSRAAKRAATNARPRARKPAKSRPTTSPVTLVNIAAIGGGGVGVGLALRSRPCLTAGRLQTAKL